MAARLFYQWKRTTGAVDRDGISTVAWALSMKTRRATTMTMTTMTTMTMEGEAERGGKEIQIGLGRRSGDRLH
jgi:hypothetical protein